MTTRLNYTSRDYAALLKELQAEAQRIYPDWTDFNEGNAGNALLSAMALVGDILNANQDAQFAECFWDTARHRASIISLAKLLGYRLRSATPAMVDIEATMDSSAGGTVTIPQGTQIYSAGLQPVRIFELQTDLVIEPGKLKGTAPAKHAQTKSESFTATGAANQRFRLTFGPYLDHTAQVTIDGQVWREVDNLVGSRVADHDYIIEVDDQDVATVVFGDGTSNGALPSGKVTVRYEIGGGTMGNVPANTLKLLQGAFTDSNGVGVALTVNNPSGATGGQEREGIDEARRRAPFAQKATNRTVAREDYEQNALVAGIVRAKAVTKDDVATLQPREIGLYLVPGTGGAPTAEQNEAVMQELTGNRPVPIGQAIRLLDPNYKPIDVKVKITAANRPGLDKSALKADAEAALRRWFEPQRTDQDDPWADPATWTYSGSPALDWGMTVYQSHLLALLFHDPQNRVFNVQVIAPDDTVCAPLEFPTVDNVEVEVI